MNTILCIAHVQSLIFTIKCITYMEFDPYNYCNTYTEFDSNNCKWVSGVVLAIMPYSWPKTTELAITLLLV